MRDEPIYDYVERGKVETLTAELAALRARVADRDHELIRVRAELAEARAERDALRAALARSVVRADATMPGRSFCTICCYHWWDKEEVERHASSCPLAAATPAAAERPEWGEQDVADSGLWCSVHGRWVTQADAHAGCAAVVRVDGGCPA